MSDWEEKFYQVAHSKKLTQAEIDMYYAMLKGLSLDFLEDILHGSVDDGLCMLEIVYGEMRGLMLKLPLSFPTQVMALPLTTAPS